MRYISEARMLEKAYEIGQVLNVATTFNTQPQGSDQSSEVMKAYHVSGFRLQNRSASHYIPDRISTSPQESYSEVSTIENDQEVQGIDPANTSFIVTDGLAIRLGRVSSNQEDRGPVRDTRQSPEIDIFAIRRCITFGISNGSRFLVDPSDHVFYPRCNNCCCVGSYGTFHLPVPFFNSSGIGSGTNRDISSTNLFKKSIYDLENTAGISMFIPNKWSDLPSFYNKSTTSNSPILSAWTGSQNFALIIAKNSKPCSIPGYLGEQRKMPAVQTTLIDLNFDLYIQTIPRAKPWNIETPKYDNRLSANSCNALEFVLSVNITVLGVTPFTNGGTMIFDSAPNIAKTTIFTIKDPKYNLDPVIIEQMLQSLNYLDVYRKLDDHIGGEENVSGELKDLQVRFGDFTDTDHGRRRASLGTEADVMPLLQEGTKTE
ncbi:uncharacterized protein RSE6_14744 [Rhynchosporium secalis]|uniref:Uncharacterized protein n=1 Tax=Rhynchosporium secalis TaxID=38038 RepID=A0A1E1MWM2_RHYSE|nr:uncharacterized protein RSE6_14744 [Rhynchosporium secalis]